jgi:hypothetical protein
MPPKAISRAVHASSFQSVQAAAVLRQQGPIFFCGGGADGHRGIDRPAQAPALLRALNVAQA